MHPETEPNRTRRAGARLTFFLVLLVCAGPLLLAFAWYFLYASGEAFDTRNYGELVTPALPLEARSMPVLAGPGAGDELTFPRERKWILVQVAPQGCDEHCRQVLWSTRQGRLSLGRDMARVKRVLIVPEEGLDRDYLAAEQRDLTVFSLREADLLVSELRAVAEPEAGRLYLVDPLGNLMMIYAPGFDPQGLLDDLEHLLRVSRVG
jgi:hypothetical protein